MPAKTSLPKFTLSGPGGQECVVYVPNMIGAAKAADVFRAKYGVIGPIDIYQDDAGHEPVTTVSPGYDRRHIYYFIYCASEQGSMARRCEDHKEAQEHARLLANAHGESCHYFWFPVWSAEYQNDGRTQYLGREEPKL